MKREIFKIKIRKDENTYNKNICHSVAVTTNGYQYTNLSNMSKDELIALHDEIEKYLLSLND